MPSYASFIEDECKKGRICPEELKHGGKRRRIIEVRATIACRSREFVTVLVLEITPHNY